MAGIGIFRARTHRWFEQLRSLESEVLDPATRSDPQRMKELLSDEFIEFGSSGRVYEKRALIDMLADEVHAEIVMRDFAVRELAPTTALVTYRTVGQSGQEARRSSVWVNTEEGWRLSFHQGTRIPNSWGPIA